MKGRPLRQIGTLPRDLNARRFADYLLSLGMKTRVDDRPEGWDLWIYNEDHFQRARDELEAYLQQPDDPRYLTAAEAAEAVRRKEKELDKNFRRNFRDSSDVWGAPGFRQRPASTLMLYACVLIFIGQNIPAGQWDNIPTGQDLREKLLFTEYTIRPDGKLGSRGLEPIEEGEVWRLITPALMHVSLLHIAFNMTWLFSLGRLIEIRRGTLRFLLLVLISAAVSNLGQYVWEERTEHIMPFMGFSGVAYAIFGYVWMKGIYQPEQRMAIHPSSVNIMIIWLFACMSGYLGPVANAAHFMGLAAGIVLGIMGF
jgi:GlpG protein